VANSGGSTDIEKKAGGGRKMAHKTNQNLSEADGEKDEKPARPSVLNKV